MPLNFFCLIMKLEGRFLKSPLREGMVTNLRTTVQSNTDLIIPKLENIAENIYFFDETASSDKFGIKEDILSPDFETIYEEVDVREVSQNSRPWDEAKNFHQHFKKLAKSKSSRELFKDLKSNLEKPKVRMFTNSLNNKGLKKSLTKRDLKNLNKMNGMSPEMKRKLKKLRFNYDTSADGESKKQKFFNGMISPHNVQNLELETIEM